MLGSGNQLKPWLDILYRRRYWILVPGLLGLVGGVVVLSQMPKLYRASAMIFITPELVSEDFVSTTVTSRIEERIGMLTVSVKSRSYIEPIAREFKLIGPKASEGRVAGVCSNLAQAIWPEFDMTRPPKWLRINVDLRDPKLAAGMANGLAKTFIEQNRTLRESQAATTLEVANQFLEAVQKKLDAKTDELTRYKSAHLLELPDQGQTNFSLMMGAQSRVNNIDASIRDLNNRITMLQAQQAQAPAGAVPGLTGPIPQDPAGAHYAQLQRELYDLKVKYSDLHPDVKAKREELDSWAKANPQVLTAAATPSTDGSAPKPAQTMIDVQIELTQKQIQDSLAERAKYEEQARTYMGRVTTVPEKQQELQTLTRDLDNLKKDYDNWSMKKAEAERSLAVEAEQQNSQFKIQDRARVPAIPFKPIPLQVILTGLGVGVALGAAASFLMEFLDNSVRSEEEFQTAFPDLPLLASIPDLDRVRKRRRRRKSTGRKAAAVLLCLLIPFLS